MGRMLSKTILRVHQEGQGAPGKKKAVLFPKLVFLYDENLHSDGKELNDVFEAALQCSAKTMYPKRIIGAWCSNASRKTLWTATAGVKFILG